MNFKKNIQKSMTSLVMTTALAFVATPLFARVDLVAIQGTWTSQAGSVIPMWGFARDTGQGCNSLPQWTVGPELTADDLQTNGNLRIRLRNCLGEAVSVIIPGQKAIVVGNASQHPEPVKNGNRITSFTTETPVGSTVDYLWLNVDENEGTYLYMSGSHPALQVHMGLYGALKIGNYPDTDADVTLLYSEIDPVLHSSATAATPLTYKPRYFLVNGEEESTIPNAGDTGQTTVLSFLNVGLDFHVPTMNGGEYMSLQAEDGNPYPFAKEQYSVNLAAGKTIDAFWQPTAEGEHVIYDRRGNGMVAKLTVGAGTGGTGPAVADDAYEVNEDNLLAAMPGVSANDDAGFVVELVGSTSMGVLSCPAGGFLCPDGTFNYQPNENFNGNDSFTYKTVATATTPSSSIATVTITVHPVNDMPIAADDAYAAVAGVPLVVAAPGVLANDQDIDGDILNVTTGGIFGADGSINFANPTTGTYPYEVCDNATPALCTTASAVITVGNDIPIAVDDSATVRRNSTPTTPRDVARNTFNLTDNDTDANGIDVTTVVLSGTTQGGTVVNNGDGTVSYTPPRNWRGTDTFTYTVKDILGETSNVATVRVRVVRAAVLPPL
jgi:FtsP/CotA-like multicopper oxidase with cupredoxin domain